MPSRATSAQPLPIARAGNATGPGGAPVVQRGFRSATRSATGHLAASAAATLERIRPGSQGRRGQEEVEDDPLPFPPDRTTTPVASSATTTGGTPAPGYSRVPEGAFDPKDLTDFQIDELVHRMIGRITRLVRTELRMDRERIGRLRDDRR